MDPHLYIVIMQVKVFLKKNTTFKGLILFVIVFNYRKFITEKDKKFPFNFKDDDKYEKKPKRSGLIQNLQNKPLVKIYLTNQHMLIWYATKGSEKIRKTQKRNIKNPLWQTTSKYKHCNSDGKRGNFRRWWKKKSVVMRQHECWKICQKKMLRKTKNYKMQSRIVFKKMMTWLKTHAIQFPH